ncbi:MULTISPECIES: AGE family epimerase/isomerase [unclassified Sphingobacterium]|uniref:AGE family epimerase/isomerase n=1 Tax=unclassified Sphingobacterium TaxID=2609468 RepID=UPI0025D62851|nr:MULTISPECIES: AGE family epimerase/isomerase [unclassified Sphingobacterium]
MNRFRETLENNILPFWSEKMVDLEFGGFYGKMDGHNHLVPYSSKGAVMHARILWTFSAAYRQFNDISYLRMAERAYQYLRDNFIDKEYGGVYWELDYQGKPLNTKKQTYAQGFALYGFSEFYRATGTSEALELSIDLFKLIEHTYDDEYGGYLEAFSRDWSPIADMRLSEKDENQVKTMNTHLHILEPYTNLLQVWPDDQLISAQKGLVDLFVSKIYDSRTGHLNLFFDREWHSTTDTISYGHDIEAAWLLWEATIVLNIPALSQSIKDIVISIGLAAVEGILPDGSMAYEFKNGHLDDERHWWVQAEAVVGYSYLSKIVPDSKFLDLAENAWNFIQTKLIDVQFGEWYWSVLPDGQINRNDDKAGFWKCPYHNGRMCLEMFRFNDYVY